jgi:quercetin dioxygenase-like cupin family protein
MSATYDRPTTLPDAYRTLAPAGPREPLHSHDYLTTIHVLEGVVYLVSDEDERAMTPGDQAVVPAGVPHRIFNAGDGEAHVLEGLKPEHCA